MRLPWGLLLAMPRAEWYNAGMKFLRTLLLAASALGSLAMGQFGPDANQEPLVTPALQASVSNYGEGSAFYLAFTADITPPWHAYYRNPATVGLPLKATLSTPEEFTVEGPFWKVPTREEGAFGISYGYARPVLVWRVTPGASSPGNAEFSVSSSVQVCSDEGCMQPEKSTTTLQLSRGDTSPAPDWSPALLEDIEVLGDTASTLSAAQTADSIQLSFTSDTPVERAYFFSDDNNISPTAEQKLEKGPADGVYILHLPRNDNSDDMYPVEDEELVGKPLPELKGILSFNDKHCRVNLNLSSVPASPAAESKSDSSLSAEPAGITLEVLFYSLFLGGLILNLMPCVFPVIGLKIMSFVELGGGSRRKVFMHSLAFVLGILISFWVLSLLLIIFSNLDALAATPWQQWANVLLHDAGAGSRSWAEWMQYDWVVYLILLLLLAMGLSMYGVFEMGVGATGVGQNLQNRKGYAGSFFSGLFVTVVATPCSGPFLGAAMPAAMALPGLMMVAALSFMALGLAFPYIILGAFPALVRLLPRPGAWMESLKQGLSFLLFAAAAWFLDIYLAFVPDSRVMVILIALVGICAAFWVYGRWCPIYRSRTSRLAGALIALGLLAVSVWGSMPHADDAPSAPQASSAFVVAEGSSPVWNEWSPELMQKALKDGHPVYVDFTAKWCATCQANKKVAYSDDVYKLLENGDVVLMRADKTRPNPAIDEEMRRLNRSAVPVNALYHPDGSINITRELLSPAYLTEWLYEQLSGE